MSSGLGGAVLSQVIPIAYIAWSIWLIALGLGFLVGAG